MLVIHRTFLNGRRAGFISGLGAATADAVYGSIAAFGLTALSSLLVDNRTLLQLIGGFFLLYLGLRILFAPSKAIQTESKAEPVNLLRAYASTFALTITNPMTILTFLSIFAGLGLAEAESNAVGSVVMVSGVFLGSALWWLTLSFGVSVSRQWMNERMMQWINRASGLVIVGFALLILLS